MRWVEAGRTADVTITANHMPLHHRILFMCGIIMVGSPEGGVPPRLGEVCDVLLRYCGEDTCKGPGDAGRASEVMPAADHSYMCALEKTPEYGVFDRVKQGPGSSRSRGYSANIVAPHPVTGSFKMARRT